MADEGAGLWQCREVERIWPVCAHAGNIAAKRRAGAHRVEDHGTGHGQRPHQTGHLQNARRGDGRQNAGAAAGAKQAVPAIDGGPGAHRRRNRRCARCAEQPGRHLRGRIANRAPCDDQPDRTHPDCADGRGRRLPAVEHSAAHVQPRVAHQRRRLSLMNLFARKKTAAFTLIEIMVVVAIIGLMAAIGMPSIIRALQKDGMRKALSDVEEVCFTARQMAIVGKQKTSVVIYPQQGRFGVEGVSADSSVTTTNAHTGKVTGSSLPDGIHFAMVDIFHKDFAESEWARVYFYPDGTCDETVLVLTGRGSTRKITLDYVTGTPTVSPVNE